MKEKENMEAKDLSLEMVKTAAEAIDSKRGQEITVIDISGMSSLGDYFVIAHGKNARQVQTMADETEEKLAAQGHRPRHIEGYTNAGWILMDYGDIVVHIFSEDERRFYDLERIWKEGRFLTMEELGIESAGQGQD